MINHFPLSKKKLKKNHNFRGKIICALQLKVPIFNGSQKQSKDYKSKDYENE